MFTLYGRKITEGLIPVFFLLVLLAGQSYGADNTRGQAQPGNESTATLRVGKHAQYVRLVFETAESNVQKASVILTGANAIKIDFQSPVSFRVPRKGAPKTFVRIEASKGGTAYEIDSGISITVTASSCLITINNLDDISVSKLSLPSRLVIDAYTSQAPPPGAGGGGKKDAVETPLSAPEASEIKFDSFVIDAGHGGYDSGVRFGKVMEKDIALSFAKELAGTLSRKGKKVILTRKTDQVVSLRDRARIVYKKSPELFISIHVSSRDEFVVYTSGVPSRPAAAGAGTDSGRDRSESVAEAIARTAKGVLKINVRIEKLPLRLLTYVRTPAVLIELPSPDKFSYDAKSRERMIAIILQGIAASSPVPEQA